MLIKILFIYIILIEEIFNFIVIPFKTHHSSNLKKNSDDYNSTDFMEYYFENKIYFLIEVGSPAKEVPFILITSTSGLNIGYSLCSRFQFSDLPKEYYQYSDENSTTYNLTSKNLKTISNTFMGSQSTELFKFYTDLEKNEFNKININDLPFIYTSKEDANKLFDDGTICGIIGLTLFERNTFMENYNIINLLKKKNITQNYIFNFEFDEKNDDEGLLIIGEEPHKYNKNKYNEEQLRNDYASAEHYELVWGVLFNSIYFFDEDKNKTNIKDIKYARFIPELNCIKGTSKYKEAIENKFFKYYMNKNICRFDKEPKYLYYVMNCDVDSEFQVKKFPTLYLENKKFNYTFELDYNDLFIKKGKKYFFMVIFPLSYIRHFEMGKVFLKKYFLSYDVDKRTISFYNKNIPIETNIKNNIEETNPYIKYLIIILGIIFLISCCIIGFYFGKKLYEKSRNKRNNELNEEYDYSLNE